MNWKQCHGFLRGARQARFRTAAIRAFALLVGASGGFADAETLPSCLPPAMGKAVVQQVDGRGVLTLQDGRTVVAEGILLPAGKGDGAPETFRKDALAALRRLAEGRLVTLRLREPRWDRYRRLRAQIVAANGGDGIWLQREMLRRGLARALVLPDRGECASALYSTEEAARQARAGLWSADAYAVRSPDGLQWRDLGSFQIVQGQVTNATLRGSRAYINFGQDWRRDFTVAIAPDDMKRFRAAAVDPQSYSGKTLRVRGWIDRLNGFEIEAASPDQIEVISHAP